MTEVPVVALIKAKAGKAKDLETLLKSFLAPTHQEAGCISYTLHRSADDPELFVFVEKWASADAFKKHLSSEHITAAFVSKEGLIADLRIIPLADV